MDDRELYWWYEGVASIATARREAQEQELAKAKAKRK